MSLGRFERIAFSAVETYCIAKQHTLRGNGVAVALGTKWVVGQVGVLSIMKLPLLRWSIKCVLCGMLRSLSNTFVAWAIISASVRSAEIAKLD